MSASSQPVNRVPSAHFVTSLMRLGFGERASVDAMLDLEVDPSSFTGEDVERAVRWITAKEQAEASLMKLTDDLDDDPTASLGTGRSFHM